MNAEPVLERLARVEGGVEEHSRMVEDIAGRFTNLEARLDRAEANANARFEHMEGAFNARFERLEGSVNARFERLEGSVDSRMNHLDAKIDRFREDLDGKMTRYFTWMIGLIVTSGLGLAYQISQLSRLIR